MQLLIICIFILLFFISLCNMCALIFVNEFFFCSFWTYIYIFVYFTHLQKLLNMFYLCEIDSVISSNLWSEELCCGRGIDVKVTSLFTCLIPVAVEEQDINLIFFPRAEWITWLHLPWPYTKLRLFARDLKDSSLIEFKIEFNFTSSVQQALGVISVGKVTRILITFNSTWFVTLITATTILTADSLGDHTQSPHIILKTFHTL